MNILSCGIFDLIHIGHINFLNKIKNKGDKLFILINSDRYAATYKRRPIINENQRLQMIKNIRCVDTAFIDDNEYLCEEIINKYNINKVYQAINDPSIWSYYYHVASEMNIMKFIKYNNEISTTDIINKILTICDGDFKERYTKENILKSEKLYGYGWQSVAGESILTHIIPTNQYTNILEIGCGLGGNCNYLFHKYSCDVTGVDICKNMIDICRERNNNNIKYILSDYKDFKINTKYDLILCRDVFLYLHTEHKYNYLKKVNSELSENGVFILIDYCQGNIKNKDFNNYCINRNWNIINIPFYKKLISDTGYKIINDGNISNKYINHFKNGNSDICKDVIENLDKKIKYLENNYFEWHYFVLKNNIL